MPVTVISLNPGCIWEKQKNAFLLPNGLPASGISFSTFTFIPLFPPYWWWCFVSPYPQAMDYPICLSLFCFFPHFRTAFLISSTAGTAETLLASFFILILTLGNRWPFLLRVAVFVNKNGFPPRAHGYHWFFLSQFSFHVHFSNLMYPTAPTASWRSLPTSDWISSLRCAQWGSKICFPNRASLIFFSEKHLSSGHNFILPLNHYLCCSL